MWLARCSSLELVCRLRRLGDLPLFSGGEALIQSGRPAVLWELFQDTLWYTAQFLFAVCIAISIFRYRLWDIDLVINRVLVYGSLTTLTMLVYLGAVGAMGALFRDGRPLAVLPGNRAGGDPFRAAAPALAATHQPPDVRRAG